MRIIDEVKVFSGTYSKQTVLCSVVLKVRCRLDTSKIH